MERDCLRLVDITWESTRFCEQPLTIEYGSSAEPRRHIPDLLVEGHFIRPLLIEVKRDDDSELTEAFERASTLAPALKRLGYDYVVVVEADVKRHAYLRNANWIARFGRIPVPIYEFDRIRLVCARAGHITLRLLGAACRDRLHATRIAARLLFEGYLTASMKFPITEETVLQWNDGVLPQGGSPWLLDALGVIR